eukprot:gene3890-3804_t
MTPHAKKAHGQKSGNAEIDGEFQAVIVMRAKPPLKTVTYHQVEKDRWFKSSDIAALAAQESAKELKAAVDAGALKT